MMKRSLVFLVSLIIFKTNLSSEWIRDPKFGHLVDQETAVADTTFNVSKLFPDDLTRKAREQIVGKLPEIIVGPGELEGTTRRFAGTIKDQMVNLALQKALVCTDDLTKDTYQQSFIKHKKRFKIRKSGEEADTKTYWQDEEKGVFYDLGEGVEDARIGYDVDKLKKEVNALIAPISPIIRNAEITKRIELEKDVKYTGRARYVLSNCVENLAYHSGCIRSCLDSIGRCPGHCRQNATKKNLQFNPDYKTGEKCAICLDDIKPVAAAKALTTDSASGGSGRKPKESLKRARE